MQVLTLKSKAKRKLKTFYGTIFRTGKEVRNSVHGSPQHQQVFLQSPAILNRLRPWKLGLPCIFPLFILTDE